jgi:hypothetical protein
LNTSIEHVVPTSQVKKSQEEKEERIGLTGHSWASLALTLNGTTQWPDNKVLRRLGETRMTGTPARIRAILERVSDALSQTESDLRSYIKQHPRFKEVGERMLQEWVKGRQLSLQAG